MVELLLRGPRGDNPLGFLTAVGALISLGDAGYPSRLGWQRVSPQLVVCDEPTSALPAITSEEDVVRVLGTVLRRARGPGVEATQRARKAMEQAITAIKKKRDEITTRRLSRDATREAQEAEMEPLQKELEARTRSFHQRLAESAPDPSVTLGKNLTARNDELLAHARDAAARCESDGRRWADLAAAYGVADPAAPRERMQGSPWALISGSGHQDFLSSVQELMVECQEEHLRRALFGPWEASDERYSLRLDTRDDRRHALMAADPTASGNKPLTLWGANRLAFEALRLFPCVPVREGMAVVAWQETPGNWQEGCRVRWPLWEGAVGADTARSLLGLRDLWCEGDAAARERLRLRGVWAVMEARRIGVGGGGNKKYNLTPAAPVWADGRSAGAHAAASGGPGPHGGASMVREGAEEGEPAPNGTRP